MNRIEYFLAELRCAALRARLAACDIDAIGIALRSGMIDAELAFEWLLNCGALSYLQPTQPETNGDAEAPT
jgi:hypothetical protein